MLSVLQTKKLTHFFNVLDVDGNGLLEKDDFIKVGKSLCLAMNIDEESSTYGDVMRKVKKMYNVIHHHLPASATDGIRLKHWLEYFDFRSNDIEFEVLVDDFIELTVNNVFEVFDQNQDGSLTIDEYMDMFKVYGIDITHTQKGFELLDSDHNERITKDELASALHEFFKSSDIHARGNWTFGNWN